MWAFVEGHPNADVMMFYGIVVLTLGLLLYRFHRKQA